MQFTDPTLWLVVTTLVALGAGSLALILYSRLKKLKKEEIEWKIGRQTDERLNYLKCIEFYRKYKPLGGAQDTFITFALNSFKRQIAGSKYLSDLGDLFKGFHYGDDLIEKLHPKIKDENKDAVLSIAENAWKAMTENKKVTEESLANFQEQLKQHWARDYELSEIFYVRIQQERQKLGK